MNTIINSGKCSEKKQATMIWSKSGQKGGLLKGENPQEEEDNGYSGRAEELSWGKVQR